MRIEHVAIYVHDMEKARDFFVKYFNADASEKYHNFKSGFSSYFLTFDGGSRLEIMQRPTMDDPPKGTYRTGYHHIAIEVGDRKDVDDITKKLQKDGYEIFSGPRTTGDGYYESTILDEEGNSIELIAEIK
ncbi:MAG: VOC family protein [Selenomonadaceae bacterium]|nr:VOC family protein [Selenomonadaceae bacterium]